MNKYIFIVCMYFISGTIYACSLEEHKSILYIQNLDLAEHDSEKGYVNKGSLVSFVSRVDAQTQSDVLNSTLFAQLAADKLYDRNKDAENWYKKYREVLSNVGWVVGNFEFLEHNAAGNTFTINNIIVELLDTIATKNEVDVVKKTLETLQNLKENDERFVLFSQSSHDGKSGNFQISAVSQSGNVPVMKLGTFHFTANSIDSRFLWFNYSSTQAHIYKKGQKVTLNLDVYKNVRELILSKLKGKNTLSEVMWKIMPIEELS